MKLYTQGILSREGVWDELGWDEARKDRERAYFAAEAADPAIDRIMRGISDAAAPTTGGAEMKAQLPESTATALEDK